MLTIRSYITEALEELRHTRWPTRQQAIRLSGIVLGFTAVSAILFGVVDFLLSELVSMLLAVSV
jgi:preprotein translocase SecE subunit